MRRPIRLPRSGAPLLDIFSAGRAGPPGSIQFTPAQVEQILRTVRRTPEVMVKVTGGGIRRGAVAAHLSYISRKGQLEIETDEGERILSEKTIPALIQLKPDFCSVTYGAGGSTRDKTLTIVDRIQRQHSLTTMAHLTCVNATKEEISAYLTEARSRGINNILALRGDPPGGTGEFKKTEGGFEFSYQLVEFIRQVGGFSIGVAGFPEGHIACKEGKLVDWQRLKNQSATTTEAGGRSRRR